MSNSTKVAVIRLGGRYVTTLPDKTDNIKKWFTDNVSTDRSKIAAEADRRGFHIELTTLGNRIPVFKTPSDTQMFTYAQLMQTRAKA